MASHDQQQRKELLEIFKLLWIFAKNLNEQNLNQQNPFLHRQNVSAVGARQ